MNLVNKSYTDNYKSDIENFHMIYKVKIEIMLAATLKVSTSSGPILLVSRPRSNIASGQIATLP